MTNDHKRSARSSSRPRAGQHGAQRFDRIVELTANRVGLGQWPWIGLVLAEAIAVERELVEQMRGRRSVVRFGAQREGGDDIEADVAVAVGVEQFGRELAEPQTLPDMPLGGAEARRDRVDRGAAVDQRRHRDKLVRRVHRSADRVFGERGFDRVVRCLDFARDRMIGVDHAFSGEFLQDLEAPSAGIDFAGAFAVDRRRMDDQVLQDTPGADAGFEGHILSRGGRSFADIGRGENELAESDVADFAASGHGRIPATGRREPSLAL